MATDPPAARRALTGIEESSRAAVDNPGHALGTPRERWPARGGAAGPGQPRQPGGHGR